MRFYLLAVVFLLMLLTIQIVKSQPFENGFEFPIAFFDTTSSPFLPANRPSPIGPESIVTISEEGHFLVGGERIRFFGMNLDSDANYPPYELADSIAARLAYLGVNIVRIHKLDQAWDGLSIFLDDSNTRTFDMEKVDRVDYFISRLKAHGVYVDMNLLVYRKFRPGDGVANANSIPAGASGVAFFDQQLIDLQKEYAEFLLGHVNPYTGIPLAEDPVLAIIEVVNENSLYECWYNNRFKPSWDGGVMLQRHLDQLDSMWTAFLREKYQTHTNLELAWQGAFCPETPMPDGGFEEQSAASPWQLQVISPAEAEFVIIEDENAPEGNHIGSVTITESASNNWAIKLGQNGFPVSPDSIYIFKFMSRADRVTSYTVAAQEAVSPYRPIQSKLISQNTDWRETIFTFKPTVEMRDVFLSVALGRSRDTFYFDDFRFFSTTGGGLQEGENLDSGTVAIIPYQSSALYTDQRVEDTSEFIAQVMLTYSDDMIEFLREDLGVNAAIDVMNWRYGPVDLLIQENCDLVDQHFYWDLPPSQNVSDDWYIHNQSMIAEPYNPVTAAIPYSLVEGKPYIISEFNHIFPNRYQCEGLPIMTAYLSYHNVDGMFIFQYNHSDNWSSDRIEGFHEVDANPVLLVQSMISSYAYRNNLISTSASPLSCQMSREDIYTWPKYFPANWGLLPYDRLLIFMRSLKLESLDADSSTDLTYIPIPSNEFQTDTGETTWDFDGMVSTVAPGYITITGFLDHYEGCEYGPVILEQGPEHASLTWMSLTEDQLVESQKSLLTFVTQAQNEGMSLEPLNPTQWWCDRSNGGWGNAPTQVRPEQISFAVTSSADSLRLIPLDSHGQPRYDDQRYYYRDANSRFYIDLDQYVDQTLWYGVELFFSSPSDSDGVLPTAFQLDGCYPNPFNNSTRVIFKLSSAQTLRLTVFDILGREVSHQYMYGKPGTNKVTIALENHSSGIYFCRFEGQNVSETLKMTLLQ